MRTILKALTLTGLCSLGALALPAQAGVVLFQDNFDSDSVSASLNFNSFTNWTVSNGTVDYIRAPNGWGIDCVAGCVDIDGSTGNSGVMTSRTSFNLLATNTYKLSIDISGNQRTQSLENVRIGLLDLVSFDFTDIAAGDIFTTYSGLFTNIAGLASIFIDTTSNDNIGAILDNVVLECVSCQPASVPEPGMLGLMGLGLLGMGVARKRKAASK